VTWRMTLVRKGISVVLRAASRLCLAASLATVGCQVRDLVGNPGGDRSPATAFAAAGKCFDHVTQASTTVAPHSASGDGRAKAGQGTVVHDSIASSASRTRAVSVIVLADEAFQYDHAWKSIVTRDLQFLSDAFSRTANVVFNAIGWRTWDSGRIRSADIQAMYDLAVSDSRDVQGDVVLALSGRELPRPGDGWYADFGAAAYFGRVALVRIGPDGAATNYRREIELHEFAHLFGAWHSASPTSVMRIHPDHDPVYDFDPVASAVIRRFRDREFRAGGETLSDDDIDFITMQFRSSRVSGEMHPIANALGRVAIALWRAGDAIEGMKELQRARRLCVDVEGEGGPNVAYFSNLLLRACAFVKGQTQSDAHGR